MWSLADGRCLLHNTKVFNGQPSKLLITDSGKFCVISGKCEEIVVISVSTFEIINIYNPARQWILASGMGRKGSKESELFFISSESILYSGILNEEIGAWTIKAKYHINNYEDSIICLRSYTMDNVRAKHFLLCKKHCFILESDFSILHEILNHTEEFAGLHIISDKKVILWTTVNSFLVYEDGKLIASANLGSPNLMRAENTVVMASKTVFYIYSIVLLSTGNQVFVIKLKEEQGKYTMELDYGYLTSIRAFSFVGYTK